MGIFRRTIGVMLLALVMPTMGYCDALDTAKGEACAPSQPDMRSLLNAYSAFADEHFKSIICGLKVLAATGEVKSGEWQKMEGLLEEFDDCGITAAAVWYAEKDGGYYTVEKGLTGGNLSDRTYFPGLIAGNEVRGDLVISRSTGKRAAIFAVPVKKGETVNGALGVSLSVDEVSVVLAGQMGLPQNFVFYALDSKGRTSLHSRPELLFAYPSDMGSETLNEAVRKMLSENEGMVEYDYQGRKKVYFRKSSLTGWVYALGAVTGLEPAGK